MPLILWFIGLSGRAWIQSNPKHKDMMRIASILQLKLQLNVKLTTKGPELNRPYQLQWHSLQPIAKTLGTLRYKIDHFYTVGCRESYSAVTLLRIPNGVIVTNGDCNYIHFSSVHHLTQCTRPIRGAALHEAVGVGVAGPALIRRGSVAKRVLESHDGEQVQDLAFAGLVSLK